MLAGYSWENLYVRLLYLIIFSITISRTEIDVYTRVYAYLSPSSTAHQWSENGEGSGDASDYSAISS